MHLNLTVLYIDFLRLTADRELQLTINNFQIETHNFKFTKHVSDDRHPLSVVNTSEPLVGVI